MWAYWRAERRTIRQGLVALVVASAGNLVSGLVLGSFTGRLEELPGLMVLVPAAIGMRGNIFGALGSRLGTSIHAGVFQVTAARTGPLRQNAAAALVLTVSTSVALGVIAKTLGEAAGLEVLSTADFVAVSLVGGIVSSIIVGAFTVGLSVRAYRRDWDLDSVTAPLVTAVGDLVTIPSLFAATLLIGWNWVTPAIAIAGGVAAAYAIVYALRTDLRLTRRIVRESLIVLVAAAVVDAVAGVAVESRLEGFIAFPVFLVILPPLVADAGAMGGVLASRLASKLHLGVLEARGRPSGAALLDATIVLLFGVWIFALLALVAELGALALGLASPGPIEVLLVTMGAGLTATLVAIVVAYFVAVATFRLGLDPDTHGIPVITATMDLVGIACLVGAVALVGLG